MGKIWTFNARDTVMFDVVMDHQGLSQVAMGAEIRLIHKQTVELLASKAVRYQDLRAPLVPHADTDDVALVFHSDATESTAYGWEIAKQVLPLLDRDWRGS